VLDVVRCPEDSEAAVPLELLEQPAAVVDLTDHH
jgi:hypothetical protein